MNRVVVTGALGTLGRFTIDTLAETHEVVGVDLHEPQESPCDTVEFLAADLTNQGPAWEIIADVAPDAVVHFAAVPGADHRADTETFLQNVTSAYNVLTAAGRVGSDVVWTSSEATYGVTAGNAARPLDSLPIDETHPQRPEDGYGLSKVVGETIADRTVRRDDISVTSIQPSWVQIPGAYKTPRLREQFELADPTPSGSLWSYIDARDVARLVRHALDADTSGHERYLAAAADNYIDVPTSQAIEAAWGELAPPCNLDRDEAAFSTVKATTELGWEPRHSWREAETADIDGPRY